MSGDFWGSQEGCQGLDWLDLLAVQGTLKSLLQHHNSKAASKGSPTVHTADSVTSDLLYSRICLGPLLLPCLHHPVPSRHYIPLLMTLSISQLA